MGNQFCSCPQMFSSNIEVPDLKLRSTYGEHVELPDEKIVRAIFAQSYQENRKNNVAKKIEENKEGLFEDEKFTIDSKENSRLSVLFDFERMKTKAYSSSPQELTTFVQLNIEFSYLACVFYFLCRREPRQQLMRQILETKETNLYGAYSLNFFCNGERHSIIVDDKMPTQSDSFVYLRIVNGVELWPLILEKGWCKQVGSYERAKGLSPEDAFEEITGIPAYSYEFRANNRSQIKTLLTADPEHNWVALIARNGLEDLKNRQVFHLVNIDRNDRYTIISPYSSFTFDNYRQEKRGEVIISEEDIFTHFEYAAIGFFRPKYANTSLSIECKSHEEVLIELHVKSREDVSIRFNQFYEGYLKEEQREHYDYSPVLIELYQINQNAGIRGDYTLVETCQGCQRSTYGARTVHLSNNIFESLEGRYIIRLETNWNHESLLHKGNLVVYSSEGNVSLLQLKNNDQMRTEVYQNFFDRRIPKENISILNEHNLEVRCFHKKHTTLFSFRNLYSSYQTFEVDFSSSRNVSIHGGVVSGAKTVITVEGDALTVIQILPLNIRTGMALQPFSLSKVSQSTA